MVFNIGQSYARKPARVYAFDIDILEADVGKANMGKANLTKVAGAPSASELYRRQAKNFAVMHSEFPALKETFSSLAKKFDLVAVKLERGATARANDR